MSDGINTVTDGAVLEVTIDRPKANAIDLAASRRAERGVHAPSATIRSCASRSSPAPASASSPRAGT